MIPSAAFTPQSVGKQQQKATDCSLKAALRKIRNHLPPATANKKAKQYLQGFHNKQLSSQPLLAANSNCLSNGNEHLALNKEIACT